MNFVIGKNGIYTQGLDPSHICVMELNLKPSWFDNVKLSDKEEIIGLNKLLFQTREYLKEKYNPDGFNVGINSGEYAGQTVFHMHIHLIPRYKNDVENPRGGVRNVIPGKGDY